MSTGRLKHKVKKFLALSRADRWMLLHAVLWLGLARMMLLVVPFRQLANRLPAGEERVQPIPDSVLLERIGAAVQVAAGNLPWRSDCFPQSIAGWMLLKHHGYTGTIHLGVERSGDEELAGHAWLTCAETVVTGGEDLDRYAEIYRLGA